MLYISDAQAAELTFCCENVKVPNMIPNPGSSKLTYFTRNLEYAQGFLVFV